MDDEELQNLANIMFDDDEFDDDVNKGDSDESYIENEVTKQLKPPADSSIKPNGVLRNGKITGKLLSKKILDAGKLVIQSISLKEKVIIGIILIVFIIIIVMVIDLKSKANNTSNAIVNNINDFVSQDTTLSEEAKAAYNEKASLLKFPLTSINTLYDRFISADFTEDVVIGYTSVFGLKDVVPDGGTVEGNTDYEELSESQSGDTGWDSGGLEMMDFETTEGELVEFELSFYTSLPDENGGYTTTATGDPLVFGVVASNRWELGTKILLEGHGVVTVLDTGGSDFDDSTRIDVCVNRQEGESDQDYKKRVSAYGHQFVKGKIISGGLK